MGNLPTKIEVPSGKGIGLLIGLACSGRLISPEMVVAMSMQHNPVHMSSGFLLIKGKPVEDAREMIVDEAIKHNVRFLWFVDDDTIPPPNASRRLIYELENHPEAMVCGGVYVSRSDPPSPVVFRGLGMGSHWHWKRGDVFEVSGMGAGCMMINMEVFKHLQKPFFKFDEFVTTDPQIVGKHVSEDIYFCEAVRAAGFKVLAHGGVLCDHYDVETGRTFSLPEDSYPMRTEAAETPAVSSTALEGAEPQK